MLKQLLIKNIILIESCDINFEKGFNVLTGETGSGKSAIMKALNLVFGTKAELNLIRNGCEKGLVEAVFEIENNKLLFHLLEEAGIDHDQDQELIVKREIQINGKSRSYINNQIVQQNFLKIISPHLGRIIGQHANQWLLCLDSHREIIDTFGDLNGLLFDFQQHYRKMQNLKEELDELVLNESKRFREIEILQHEKEEIESARLKEDEDDELFQEYAILTQAETLASKASEINQMLNGERISLLTQLSKLKNSFQQVSEIDSSFVETKESFNNALLELQEVAYTVRSYEATIEFNPQRIEELNERITLITKLKKKYGKTIPEIQETLNQITKKLNLLENQDLKIEEIRNNLLVLNEENNRLAFELSEKRKEAANAMQKLMLQELKDLNMPKAFFEIEFKQQKRNHFGDDFIEFYLTPNVGEKKISIKDSASGGELSRILLAIQKLLAGKESVPTLIFDEVDANIGGETASIIGHKLKELGQSTQVFCITHFPQVAKQADHHFKIYKQEDNGRTTTKISKLDKEENSLNEIRRMRGEITIT